MELGALGRLLVLAGAALPALGVLVMLLGRVPLLGHLPGDILIRRGGLTVYIPLGATVLLSIVLTVPLNILLRLFRPS